MTHSSHITLRRLAITAVAAAALVVPAAAQAASAPIAVVELERGVTARAAEHRLDELQSLGRLVAGARGWADHD